MRLSFVLLPKSQMPAAAAISNAYRRIAPKSPPLLSDAGEGKDNVLTFRAAQEAVHVALMPAPVPNGEADDAARFSISSFGTGWSLPDHQAHLIVAMPDSKLEPLEALQAHTRIVAAVAEASGAVGIYCGDAHATHDPEFFRAIASEPDLDLPMPLWSGVSVAMLPDRISLLSLGMAQFDLPDLLLTAPKGKGGDALELLFDLLLYVARRGEPIREGETVGRSGEERLPVHYVASPIDPQAKVWSVDLP